MKLYSIDPVSIGLIVFSVALNYMFNNWTSEPVCPVEAVNQHGVKYSVPIKCSEIETVKLADSESGNTDAGQVLHANYRQPQYPDPI